MPKPDRPGSKESDSYLGYKILSSVTYGAKAAQAAHEPQCLCQWPHYQPEGRVVSVMANSSITRMEVTETTCVILCAAMIYGNYSQMMNFMNEQFLGFVRYSTFKPSLTQHSTDGTLKTDRKNR